MYPTNSALVIEKVWEELKAFTDAPAAEEDLGVIGAWFEWFLECLLFSA